MKNTILANNWQVYLLTHIQQIITINSSPHIQKITMTTPTHNKTAIRIISILGMSFVAVLSAWLFIIQPMSLKKGRYFPELSQVQYAEGTLKGYAQRGAKGYQYSILTLTPSGTLKAQVYACDYASSHRPTDDCLDWTDLKPYLNQPARIGWYYQPDYLWFHNPHPQLVSLEVAGKTVRSYDDTKQNIEKYNNPTGF